MLPAGSLVVATGGFLAGHSGAGPDATSGQSVGIAEVAEPAETVAAEGGTAEAAGEPTAADVHGAGATPAGGTAQPMPAVDPTLAIKDALAVVKKRKRCLELEAVAAAWASLSRVPPMDVSYGVAKNTTRRLEGCRKKAMQAAERAELKQRARERHALAKALAANGDKVKPKLHGKGKTILVVKWPKATAEAIDAAFAGGSTDEGTLLGRLQAAGFVEVTLTGGDNVEKSFTLAPSADGVTARQRVEELGLTQPLRLP